MALCKFEASQGYLEKTCPKKRRGITHIEGVKGHADMGSGRPSHVASSTITESLAPLRQLLTLCLSPSVEDLT